MKKYILLACIVIVAGQLHAQDELLKELEKNDSLGAPGVVYQVFKGTRLVNGHTVETKPRGTLEFIFAHRFGALNGGLFEMFGLDAAYVRLGLDYGLTEHMSVSIGRNSVDKTVDGYVKYKILRQHVDDGPAVSVTALGGLAYKLTPHKNSAPAGFENIDRIAYVAQLLIARKLSRAVSVQMAPVYIHKNAVDQREQKNDQLALGMGGRVKLSKTLALNGEYYFRLGVQEANPYHNTAGIGLEIETGGHVFQIIFTNTRGLTERAFITESGAEGERGDIHFGFNVTRTFQFRGKQK